ncbi:DeoR/GlpR family DNA-binding transcription regulator [Mediterraneibacter massiliensis]|uniref:DeoR/GlpR family DNA-binding transcription regulator n=1 Tax=Mediterraneibacter massiliensis TaxID=1720300 RepID=UPI000E4DB022|nr:DeoR/GlpR family DNA-binding transcription regulator [Mediterraneibacter massiliensis]RGT73376.1 DeoR/GlpR transcriptional regulator [Ruminococcus sp. AF18-22]
MIQNERLERIMDLLQKEKTVSVIQLSELLQVTPKTVRLDLKKLEKANVLQRVHGGAILCTQKAASFPIYSHREKYVEEKRKIAKKAFSLLKEYDIILLDDGSTSLELARLLGDFKITVLTNDILIINELMYKPNVTVYVIGGVLKRDGESFVVNGEDSIQFIKKYRVNKLFLGISTIDIENGLMIFYYGDRSTKRAFMAAADEVICMADHSKFNHTAFTRIASVGEINTIITDSVLPKEEEKKYQDLGIRIIYT